MNPVKISTRNPNLELERPPLPVSPQDSFQGPRPDSWWTGSSPLKAGCPGLGADGKLHSLRMPNLKSCTRQQVLDYFQNTWALTDLLFASLKSRDAFYSPPYHRLRHPLIFYYGHPAVLYINKLRISRLVEAIRPDFEVLFQTGVDEMSWDDLLSVENSWPEVEQVVEYRRDVYRTVRGLIKHHEGLKEGHPPITPEHELWALFMGFEHERIHLETSSVLIRELPLEWVQRPAQWVELAARGSHGDGKAVLGRDFPVNDFVAVTGDSVHLGKPVDWPSFGWDNEYGGRSAKVGSFRVQRCLVSNGEYLDFVKAGGYLDPDYWSKEGWEWRQFRNAKCPTFWVSAGPAGMHDYRLRSLFEINEMPWSWPVEVNFHEAKAYAKWRQLRDKKQYRLLTEAEHHRLRAPVGDQADGFGRARPEYNLDLASGSPGPVDKFARAESGVYDLFGNVWQWSEDTFNPLEGFQVHPIYDDFSTPCFDGRHQMILGGSFISTGDEASTWARFHFRPHFFQHAGFRLVEPGAGAQSDQYRGNRLDVYEQDQTFSQYMALHYAPAGLQMPFEGGPKEATEFPVRCAMRAVELARRLGILQTAGSPGAAGRALDVGCAVGRSAFELARAYDSVVAIDGSERFIKAAGELKERGRLRYVLPEEGDISVEEEGIVPSDVDRTRVTFHVGDACDLPALGRFDLVFVANLLCRLSNPRRFLDRLGNQSALVRPGGLLFITTPCTWMETYTPKQEWLGGVEKNGQPQQTFDGLKAALGNEFELVAREDIHLTIREHRRKYQYIVAEMTAWRRRGTADAW